MNKILKIIFSILACLLILAGCTNNTTPTSNSKIKVVTSVNFYAEVAKNIFGDKAEVVSIIDNTAVDPHDFEPTANDAKKVADANIVIYNGGGYDSWFEKLVENNNDTHKINAAKLINLPIGANEHIWYNPQVLKNVAEEVAKIAVEKDNSNAEVYNKNKSQYISELEKISNKLVQLKEKTKGKYVISTEPVFDYVINELDLKSTESTKKLAKATADGNDPAPQDLKNIQQEIKDKKIAFLINNTQTINKTVEGIITLAEENHIPILNVTETQPNNHTYVEWMLEQYDKLEEILNGGHGEAAYHNADAKESHGHQCNHNHSHEGHNH